MRNLRKRFFALVLSLVMALSLLPGPAYAALGDLLADQELMAAWEEAFGEDAEEIRALMDSLGLLDEDGNLITDCPIVLDGEEHTLESIQDLLSDPEADLTRVAYIDGTPIALGDLKTILELEEQLQRLQETYFSGRTFSDEALDNLNSLMAQLQTTGLTLNADSAAPRVTADQIVFDTSNVRTTSYTTSSGDLPIWYISAPTLLSRAYLAAYANGERSWTAPSFNENAKPVLEDANPGSEPAVNDDGSLSVYISDENSENYFDSRIYAGSVGTEGEIIDGDIDTTNNGHGDMSPSLSGDSGFTVAAWIRLFEDLSQDDQTGGTQENSSGQEGSGGQEGGGGGGSSRPTPSLSDRAIDDIQDARPGDTVEITLRPGRTTLEREVFEELAGQDITLEIDAGDGVLWTVNGLDIPENARLHDLDLDVDLGDSGIPATVLNAVTGEISTVQLSLAHDGQFGFTMTLSAPLGRDNADYWANLYWYNEETEELEFQQAARIADDGTAEFALDHASDYAIVIDDRSHEPVDLPFNDVPEGYWAYDAIQYVYGEGLMAGSGGGAFAPDAAASRGMVMVVLWRLAGSPQVNYLMPYSDVEEGQWYAEAVRWASAEGVVGGYGDGTFRPGAPVSREELAVMLHRFAQYQGCDVSIGESTNILSYADAFDVSEYAVSALQWACGAGIIYGTGDGSTLSPLDEATRAQAAVMLMRFCQLSP